MIETDAPYCDIRPTHASHKLVMTEVDAVKKPEKFEPGKQVKGRNEPCNVVQVAEVIDSLLGEGARDQATANTYRLFPLLSQQP